MERKKRILKDYKRESHFDYFNSLSYPYVGVTVNVEITDLLKKVKAEKLRFFLTFCYCVSKAANGVPEFRQRIVNNSIVEYESCRTSHTVALEDGTYCYCTLESSMPFPDYLDYAVRAQEAAKSERSIEEDREESNDKIFISTLPWLTYTSFIQPVPIPADSNPRITWGKYYKQEEKVLMPVSVLCNHALVDGKHMADFYEALDREICAVCGPVSLL